MNNSSAPFTARLSFGRLGQIDARLEPILATVALTALIFVPAIGTFGALIFLACGVLLCILRPAETIGQSLRHWPVLLLPAFCILSFIWSREPVLSMRFGVQLLATVVVTITICRHLSPRQFILTLFACLAVAMLASLVVGEVRSDTGARTGIYGSKNAFAGAALTFTVLAFGVVMMRHATLPLRALGLASFVVGTFLVLSAQSVSATLFLLPTLIALLIVLKAHRLGTLLTWSIGILGTLGLILAGLTLQAHWIAFSTFVLDATGKDLTLTGRTELWASALSLIEQRPLLGVGYQAFWVQGHADAELLWYMFGIESRNGFNFHNMFLSNAVEVGILGALLQTGLLFAATLYAGVWAVRQGAAIPATLFALCFSAVLGSLIEVPLFFQFSLRTVVILAVLIYAREAVYRGHARTV